MISGPSPQGSNRVLRGGNYFNDAVNCRTANRNYNLPDNRWNNNGVRLALPASSRESRMASTEQAIVLPAAGPWRLPKEPWSGIAAKKPSRFCQGRCRAAMPVAWG